MSRETAAIAYALYDTFHTARLSEHPEDAEQYERHAANFVKWLGVHGFRVVAIAPASDGSGKDGGGL